MAKATGPTYKVAFRRRRENRTNYTKRLGMIKAGTPRLVVRASNKNIVVQIIAFHPKGDRTLAMASSHELEKFGWLPQANTPTAYLTGMLASKRAKSAGTESAHLDIGMASATNGRILFAAALGAKEGGLKLNMPDTLVDVKRISGTHISEYAKKLETENKEKYEKQFSRYAKKNIDVKNLPQIFEETKGKILSR
ncbi:MAG: 50S ribosomal protein L18 [Candidatus Micrarchaeota archaeon]